MHLRVRGELVTTRRPSTRTNKTLLILRCEPLRASKDAPQTASSSQLPLHLLNPEALDDVANAHIFILLERHAAFLA
jgi:hypothetical protein